MKTMIADLPLSLTDIVRLFVETIERAELRHENRETIIRQYRRIATAGISRLQEEENTVPFAEAVRHSLESRRNRRPGTLADLRSYTARMLKQAGWAEKPLRSIRVQDCRSMLQAVFGHSAASFRKARCILHSIFSHGRKQGWCSDNPVASIDAPVVLEQRIEILRLPQIRRLHRTCRKKQQEMEAPLALMLWCGIRPGEIRRMNWADIDWKEGVAYVDPRTSKTGGARLVELRGPARALRPPAGTPLLSPIAPPNWDKRWRRLRRQAGLRSWQQDALRHTFASMHMRHYRNLPLLQAEMGHRDGSLLHTRYLNLRNLSADSARRFWTLRP